MRYFGGGIGHQSQHARWVSGAQEDPHDNNMDIDSDPALDDNMQLEGMEDRLQQLHQMALETSARPADSDDSDVATSDSEDSENAFSVNNNSSDDDSGKEVDDELYFGPEDGGGGYWEDTGFSAF